MQVLGLQVFGDEFSHPGGAFDVVRRRFLVQAEQVGGGVVGAGLHGHHRQAAVERGLAQFHDAWIRLEIAAQQQAGELDAVERSQAGGEDNVVAVTGGDHQHARLQQRNGAGNGACAEQNLVHAALLGLAGMQNARFEQFGDIAGAQRIQLLGEGDRAQQLEVARAEDRQLLLEPFDEGGQAVFALDLVEDHAKHLRVLGAAEQLRLDFEALGHALERVLALRGDQDDLGVQALGQVAVDARRVVELARRHHAFDDHHILAGGDLLVTADDVFEQQVQLAIGQLAFHLLQRQGFGRAVVERAFHQNARALEATVEGEGLGDGLEEADLQAGAFEGADQAKAYRVEAAAKT